MTVEIFFASVNSIEIDSDNLPFIPNIGEKVYCRKLSGYYYKVTEIIHNYDEEGNLIKLDIFSE